jgi:hypothetical protein
MSVTCSLSAVVDGIAGFAKSLHEGFSDGLKVFDDQDADARIKCIANR